MSDKQYHIQLGEGQAGGYAFLPGDPGRSELIASHLDNPTFVASNREFTTWNGYIKGELVTVCSTGVGSPSSSICMEELAKLGTHTFIRVGTCGALQPKIETGDIVVLSSALRLDGSSDAYAPKEFPAVADYWVTKALVEAADKPDSRWWVGATLSGSAFYAGMDPDQTAIPDALKAASAAWRRCGVLAVEEEAALLYVLASIRGLRAGGICVAVNAGGSIPKHGKTDLHPLIDTAVFGLAKLIEEDRAPSQHPSRRPGIAS